MSREVSLQDSAEARSAGANNLLKAALEAVELGKKVEMGTTSIFRLYAHAGTHYATLAKAYVEAREVLRELTEAAERDMKSNQDEEDGGYWSPRTENAIAKARALTKENTDG